VRFISEHKSRFGVEPICRVLTEHGVPIAPSAYYDAVRRGPSARAIRDEQLKAAMIRVDAENYGVYGARKVWLALNREGIPVARCTVERLMRELGLAGARRGRRVRTTRPDAAAARPVDLVRRQFTPPGPDRLWVATLRLSRPGPGWSTWRSSSMRTPGGSWAGEPPPPCAPAWSWTPSSRRCGGQGCRGEHQGLLTKSAIKACEELMRGLRRQRRRRRRTGSAVPFTRGHR
jgi:hypothetical protein